MLENNEKVKEKIEGAVNSAKPHVKKGVKITKRVGIGYLCFIAIIFILVITMFIFGISNFIKTNNEINDRREQIEQMK